MKIATWNVNSLNVRLAQVQDWLQQHRPDVLVLQELKLEPAKYPSAAFGLMGYQSAFSSQKTYNGVAIISPHDIEDVCTGLPDLPDDPQKRVIAATIQGVRVINVYCVNGEALGSEKFVYKRQWFAALRNFVAQQMQAHENVVLLGDFNIAPTDADCYDPEKWRGQIHCSDEERTWFQALLNLGLTDALRHVQPYGAAYTWWDYRGAMFQRGLGLRIDHILTNAPMTARLQTVEIDQETRALERPSDHAPVSAVFADAV